jgi:hypothetical protein
VAAGHSERTKLDLPVHVQRSGNGRAREMGIGSLKTVALSEARNAARECRKLLTGIPTTLPVDPIEHRRALRESTRITEGDDVPAMRRGVHRDKAG